MRKILLLGFLIVLTFGFSQTDFSAIDKKSIIVPDSLTDYKAIADYLTIDLETEKEKARAIYIWIAHNIEYDLSQINSSKGYSSNQEIIDEVLNNRKGVCHHYAELFLAMSKSVGLKSYYISGYTRDIYGEIGNSSHAWNGIKIDSDYYLIDVTWAAGYTLNGKYIHKFTDKYFLKLPNNFIKNHMPFDPIWQFIDNPINNDDFVSKDFSKLNKKGNFAYKDSIQQFNKQNELEQLENSNRRIIASGLSNNQIQKRVDENIFQIANRKYNLAIDTLNYGINSYNLYITHKNKQFRNPKLKDYQIKELIDNADYGFYAANDIFYKLSSTNKELNGLISKARYKTSNLIFDLEREKKFVENYLKMWKPLRSFMF